MKLIYLSDEFYERYGSCKEILQKRDRPYACLSVVIDKKLYAIPFRHNIQHSHCFRTIGDCGLDYTKAVVISKKAYIGKGDPQINQKEFNIIKGKEDAIVRGLSKYIKLYKKARLYPDSKHYANVLGYSSLQYFDI